MMASQNKQKWKLKDPKVLRIFFSSPFNGMEGEREELTRKYFPQFQHACNSHGMQFVAVDMRWGITAESADNAQVISICLRELDRSDVFIGFFGQRYGWHGESDEQLQKNFDNAVRQYPWLSQVRDRSVTELEYLHGHLNHPGHLPACICFRDKAYDDANREKAENEGSRRNIVKYSAESEHSSQMMKDLIQRVHATESELLGLDVKYTNPKVGAKFMFDSVWKTCLQLIADANAIELSPLQQERACHDALISSLTSVYFGGDDYWDKLNFDNIKAVNGYLIHGPQGSGKSSLMANLVKKLEIDGSGFQVIYHFIGSGPGTTSPENILQRLVAELENIDKNTSAADDCGGGDDKNLSDIGKRKSDVDIKDLFVTLQSEMERVVSFGTNLVLILDGLNKVKASSKTAKHLFWIPSKLPKGVTLFATTASTDQKTFDLLVKEREFVEVELQPLSLEVQSLICKELLMRSGKELSAYQLQRIVDAEQTKNPRFLKTVLLEISIFGYFRLLDNKIDSLVNCDGVTNLLSEVLMRMEQDYNVNGHPICMVNEVLSAIAVSHRGLSETEIQDLFIISSHNWSPFYFSLENFLICHGGLFRFSFPEMQKAVEDRYLQRQEERLSAMGKLVNYFKKIVQIKTSSFSGDLDSAVFERVASELPWVQKKIADKKGLSETISDPKILYHLEKKSIAELIDLWKDTDLSANDFCSMILKNFDLAINDIHNFQNKQPKESQEPPGFMLLPVLTAARTFFAELLQHEAGIRIIKRKIRILEGIEGKVNEHIRQVYLRDSLYYLATAYLHDSQYDKALSLFESIKTECEQILLHSDNKSIQQTLGFVYNGIGVLYETNLQSGKAQPYFIKARDIHELLGNTGMVADCETNIGMTLVRSDRLEEALEYFNSALQKYEREYFGHLPLNVGNLLTNIALCYRKMNNLDLAEEMYNRSLEVKINAVGPQHEVVAAAYTNLGALEMCRENYEKSEEYTCKALDIMEALGVKLEQNEMWQMLENRMVDLCRQDKKQEALAIFMKVFPILKRDNKIGEGHTGLHMEMMQYMLSCNMFKDVANFMEAYVTSPKLRQPTSFKILHYCDSQLPVEERPVRPEKQTIPYALNEIFPGNNELTAYYGVNVVLPANDIDLLLRLLKTMDEMNPDFLQTTYEAGAIWCDDSKNYDALLKVAEAGLVKYPEAHNLKARLFDALRQLHRYEEAYKYVPMILEKHKNNQLMLFLCGQVAVAVNDLDLCQELWRKVATMEDESLANMAKDGLESMQSILEEANKEDNKNKSE